MQNIPYLDETNLKNLAITTQDVVAEIEDLIVKKSDNKAWSAAKAVLQPNTTEGDDRYMMAALAAMDDPSLLAVKTVVLNPDNSNHNLPQINGLVTVLSSQTGLPVAILDGNWITAVRTAGLSATAAKYLARKDAKIVGFIGCGVQARSHLEAFCDGFPIEKVLLFGRGKRNIELTKELAISRGLDVEICDRFEDVTAQSDILTTSLTYTPQLVPFLKADAMKQGSFAAVTDLGAPWVKGSFAEFDVLAIDDLVQEKSLPNKIANMEDIKGDIFDLVMGRINKRTSDKERTAFVFRGLALGDLALTSLVIKKAGLV
jgi:ornithine cyclodeaminase/alanine dehydrogenase-like protein (mu-crystallin family)